MSSLQALAAALPQCASACLMTAASDSSCAITNQTCVCHDEGLNTQATACILESCTVREALSTKNLTSTYCGIIPATIPSYVPVIVTFVVLCAVSILLRVIARLKTRVPVWWDDFIITLSFLSCVAFTVIMCKLRSHGLGTDIWVVPFDDITLIFKAMYFLFVLYITSRHLVRLSILLFYYRFFGHVPLARRLIQFSFVLIITCCVAFDFAILFGCTPIDYFWTIWEGQQGGHCISFHAIFWAGAFIVIAIDLWIMLLPIPFIVRLKLSLRKRILSGIKFTFGTFVIAVSLYRLTTIDRFTLSHNPTVDFVDIGIWSGIELYVGMICACLPNFYTLLKPVNARMGSWAQSSRPGGSGSWGGSRSHRHLQDEEEPDTGHAIRATTVINVEEHGSNSKRVSITNGYGPGQNDAVNRVQGIELGTMMKGTTYGRAWS
ncbi:hypothetical protein N8I77_011192 [Diaporthe amygdali]|uniref:CFEM domain-containing protein n=1 Tax=Phomopsis amygdali TaxID=1214568 RepID=A0AAD9S7W6_PHOAM|nr:hypothetical protein N8I77_011192 [Diaporthe amygdali]